MKPNPASSGRGYAAPPTGAAKSKATLARRYLGQTRRAADAYVKGVDREILQGCN